MSSVNDHAEREQMEAKRLELLRAAVLNAREAAGLDAKSRRKLAGFVGELMVRAVEGGGQAATAR
jgi:hypothetical protein